jgi:hypothetical protein
MASICRSILEHASGNVMAFEFGRVQRIVWKQVLSKFGARVESDTTSSVKSCSPKGLAPQEGHWSDSAKCEKTQSRIHLWMKVRESLTTTRGI